LCGDVAAADIFRQHLRDQAFDIGA